MSEFKPSLAVDYISEERPSTIDERTQKLAQEFREIGIPVDDDLRLGPPPEINDNPEKKKRADKREKLIACLLNQYLGDQFVVVRTNPWDDRSYSADFIILDRNTKMVLCAIDESGAKDQKTIQGKMERAKKKGLAHGIKLNYCLAIDENGRISLKKEHSVPLILMLFSKVKGANQEINNYIKKIDSTGEINQEEEIKILKIALLALVKGLEDLIGRIKRASDEELEKIWRVTNPEGRGIKMNSKNAKVLYIIALSDLKKRFGQIIGIEQ